MDREILQKTNLGDLLLEKTEWFENQLFFHGDSSTNDFCLKPTQRKVLSMLKKQPLRNSDLARKIGISQPAVHKTISNLLKSGLVEMFPDPTNKSAKLVRMTKAGEDKIKGLTGTRLHIEQDLAEKIGGDKVQMLYEVLGCEWGNAGVGKAKEDLNRVAVLLPKYIYEILYKLQALTGDGILKNLNKAVIGFFNQVTGKKDSGTQLQGELDKMRAHLKKVKEKHIGDEKKIFNRLVLDAVDNSEDLADNKENKYRDILEYSSDVVYRVNLNTRKFEYVSPSSEKEWSAAPEQLLSFDTAHKITDSIYPGDREKIRKCISESISNTIERIWFFEFRGKVKKWKGYRWFSNRYRTVVDENNKVIALVGSVRDITESKQEEEELMKFVDELESKVKEYSVNLEETNTALRVLLKQNQKETEAIEEKILFNMKELVMPVVDKLKHSRSKDMEKYIGILESNLNQITSSFSSKLTSKHLNLTHQEIQVSNHILHGKTTKEIAELMGLSIKTIDFHRAKIRKKMNLTNKQESLRAHLLSLQ